jgi:hypothetical protein
MALRWLEGFRKIQNVSTLARYYDVATGGVTVISSRRGNTTLKSKDLVLRTPELASPDQNTWVIGFAFKIPDADGLAASPVSIPYVSLRNASGEQLRLEFIDGGAGSSSGSKPGNRYFKVRLMRGATEIATSDDTWATTVEPTREWVYFELKATIDTATGGTVELKYHLQKKVKNQTVTWDASVSGINTADQGASGADHVEISYVTGDGTDQVAFDDIYILDSSGSVNNDYLGELIIEGLDITGDGDTLEWDLSSAGNLVDAWDEGASEFSTTEDDKQATSQAVGEIHLGTLSDTVDILNTTVVGVQTRLSARMNTTGTRVVQVMYRKTTGSPAEIGGGTLSVNSTALTGLSDVQELDPNTGLAWVVADLNGLQVGCELDS